MKTVPGISVSGHAEINGASLFDHTVLDLVAGQWTCLLGGSGVGKTTILRLIAGLQTGADFKGEITASDNMSIPARTAYMAQNDLLLPWASVKHNITLGARLRGEPANADAVDELIEWVQLTNHAHKKPGQLSGGQRQRVALARTLLEDKPIILLDEPFSALDAQTRTQMQDLAVELLAGRTVLMVTHDPAEAARLGHTIAVLSSTGICISEPPATPIPREIDAMQTLRCQAALLKLLLGEVA
ncbi:MAG: ABC transporter ATP-binding protein [Pseudomonadota bacterium]